MMYKIKIFITIGFCLLLAACSLTNTHQNSGAYPDDLYDMSGPTYANHVSNPNAAYAHRRASDRRAYVALAESAESVSQSLVNLNKTEQAANPPKNVSTPPNPASYGMGMKASIDWNGPIKPVVQQLANAANYKLRVMGKKPSVPVIVSVSAKKAPVGNILRNIGYQSGNRAKIVVYPSKHTIELRYADM